MSSVSADAAGAQAVDALISNDAAAAAPGGVDRRARLRDTIESLVRLRQEVINGYCRLAGITSIEAHGDRLKPEPALLVRFCEIMVDYTAMGHFEVYQRIIEGNERRGAVRETAADVYPAIAETTDYLVDFNDKYDDFDLASSDEVASLAADLPRLGEILALRAQLEDQLLSALSR